MGAGGCGSNFAEESCSGTLLVADADAFDSSDVDDGEGAAKSAALSMVNVNLLTIKFVST